MSSTLAPLVFFRDRGSESDKAAAALAAAHLVVQEIVIEDPIRDEKPVPRLLTPEGFFDTLDGILWYTNAYRKGSHAAPET